jgi:formiminotetrahydrofolate cyclodeaminase
MVGSFTKGKKKFADVEDSIISLQEKCDALQNKFLSLMDDDAENFTPLSKAYGMKEDTEEQRAEKTRVMEEATVNACRVPEEIMELCCEAIDVLAEFLKIGNPLLVSDVGVGVLCCKAALYGASLNVYINTKSMQNKEKASSINERTGEMLAAYGDKADTIYNEVAKQIQ